MEQVYRTMTWCAENRHDNCKRTYRRFRVDERTNKIIWLDEEVICQCSKRGCKCYVAAKDRTKPKKAVKRKGK
jgi:hypothetical protein